MWITLLVMAVAVSLEPFRIAMSALILSRPRPQLQLAAFLCGGFLMGLSVGTVVLFIIDSQIAQSAHFTLPKVQIAVGMLALAASGIVALTTGRPRTAPAWLAGLLTGRSLWVAGFAGLGIALPSLDYLAVLAVIAAGDGETPATKMAALVVFHLVAFAPLEIPLLASLFAPERTHAAMNGLNRWLRTRGRYEVAALLAVVGVVLLTAGLLGV